MSQPASGKRYFEDLIQGEVIALGRITVTREMIIGFAQAFDPLPFHLDEKAAKASLLGGLAASGWQTASLSLKLLTDAFLLHTASMGGAGFSELKWKKPVLAGDTIGGTVRIAELRASQTRPGIGLAMLDFDIRKDKDVPVLSMRLTNLFERRGAPHEAVSILSPSDDSAASQSGDKP